MKSSKPENNTERVLLGKIVGAQGIRGEVKIYAFGDAPSDFTKYEKAFLVLRDERDRELDHECDQKEKLVRIEKARIQGNLAIVKFSEIADRNAAEDLRDAEVFVEAADLEELPEDTYYVRDLEGLRVIDDDTGEVVGEISEVIQNAAQDVYRIVLNAFGESEGKGEGGAQDDSGAPKESLVPAVKEFIKSVDLEAGTIRIHFIEGMR